MGMGQMGTTADNPARAAFGVLPTLEERLALVERVAASEQFSRSARLRDFLLYVGKQSLKDGCPEIHEQEIGARVFGRPASYDRSSDNIVRVNATELRKRIDSYFESAGAAEPLFFDIPRGGYRLVFHRRVSEKPEEEAPEPSEPAPGPETTLQPASPAGAVRASSAVARFVWPAVCAALVIGCVSLYLENRTMKKALYPWDGQPALTAFWGGFLDPHRQTDLVLPDDSASVM